MPSAFPGFATAIPLLPSSAPVWLDSEDCRLVPRCFSLCSSWEYAATQSCITSAIPANVFQLMKGLIASMAHSPAFRKQLISGCSLLRKVFPCELSDKTWEVWSTNVVTPHQCGNQTASAVGGPFIPTSDVGRAARLFS